MIFLYVFDAVIHFMSFFFAVVTSNFVPAISLEMPVLQTIITIFLLLVIDFSSNRTYLHNFWEWFRRHLYPNNDATSLFSRKLSIRSANKVFFTFWCHIMTSFFKLCSNFFMVKGGWYVTECNFRLINVIARPVNSLKRILIINLNLGST